MSPAVFSIPVATLISCVMLSLSSPALAEQDAEAERAPRPAKIIAVAERPRETKISQPIVVEPDQSAVLTLLEGGVLQEFPVKEGMLVKKGDLIARVDTRILENNVNQARSQLAQAKVEFERAKILLKQGNIPESTYDQRATEYELGELNVEASVKRLEDATLLAPFDGVIALVNVDQFQTVNAQQEIVTLQSENKFRAVMHIPASQLVDATDVDILESHLALDVAPLISIPAEFRSLAQQADPSTQTYEAQMNFTRPDGLVVLPGMTGQVYAKVVPNASKPYVKVIEVPMAAVQYDGQTPFVWLVQDQGDALSVTRRDIVLEDEIGINLAVLEGLEVGDEIVGAGASYLFEGMKIRRFGG
ncbi:RND family efflux transporter, MFP subunit [Shimia gijangensis]|uniref:RND family efflux transporter, MFP subunit n=1 Tax=Shimia gijangensis TaxID=1470563 RepID=A0A1M6HIC1_9RHOB|nr:efflux RND transporter periplasmic adaptor subunit [Shimia gijangensis]SHJ21882.1 RND family efflux transporter, MFP subunit [Shimia gijangensis]